MLLKLSSVIATALAAASLTSASAINLEQRQAPAAACTFVVNPSGTPDPSAELFSEWNYSGLIRLFGPHEYSNFFAI